MKTLILNGSPRKDGDTAALLGAFCRTLEGEAVSIDVYGRDDVAACTDCRYCWTRRGCAIKDGMREIYRLVEQADNIVLASPVYFSELTGPLLSLCSRFQTYYAARVMRKESPFSGRKNGVLLLAAGGDGKTERAAYTATAIFNQLSADCRAVVVSANTDRIPADKDEAALEKAGRAADGLARLHKNPF